MNYLEVNKQRVSIGRAIINNPALVLADEPTGNLDSKASDEIVALLKESNKKYNTTIIVLHMTLILQVLQIELLLLKMEK